MTQDRIVMIEPETLAEWLERGEATLYDVREPAEFEQARIAGATLAPLSAFDPSRLAIDPDKRLVFHCKSGVRCGIAAERLIAAGHGGRIHRLAGGIVAWAGAGYPIVRDT